MENNKKTILSYSDKGAIAANIGNEELKDLFAKLHSLTDQIDRSELAEQVKFWMDRCPGSLHSGGWGHRIIHGHSIEDVFDVYNKFGVSGVIEWKKELAYDFSSPHGLPLPFADEMRSVLGLNIHQSTEWLCVNLLDTLSSVLLFAAINSNSKETMPSTVFMKSIIGGFTSAFYGNPIGILVSGYGIVRSTVSFVAGDEKALIDYTFVPFTVFNDEFKSDFKDPSFDGLKSN